MAQDGFHPPLEEYLEAIHSLNEEGSLVIQARLVEQLHYTPQAVSQMVQRLVADGYIARRDGGVQLTEKGRDRAESVVRKHRLAERFLVDILGLPWSSVHEEAGRWEHVISAEVEERFIALLGNPTTCPHGNPIPGTGDHDAAEVAMTEVVEGETVRLARVTERIETDHAALSYLDEHGLLPGQDARVSSRAPDGTLTLEMGEGAAARHVAVGPAMCRQLYVVPA